jgi:putative ABC transport system substrate-binding protein
MSEKIFVWLLATVLLTIAPLAQAPHAAKVARIGFLGTAAKERIDAFRHGLRDLGWVEGQNITIEYRSDPQQDRLPSLAAELVRLKVDVIVTPGAAAALAAKQATKTIPIVMASIPDPIEAGLVASLARPGGNVTGLSNLNAEVGGKRLELLKETVPKISRVAALRHGSGEGSRQQMNEIAIAARALTLRLQSLEARGAEDYENAFLEMVRERANALITLASPQFTIDRLQLVNLAAKHRLPAIYADRAYVESGGLMSYGPDRSDLYRRAATYVDKILKGAKPADLPVEQPTKFQFVINLKTAKQIGLTIPPNVLARADRVIR